MENGFSPLMMIELHPRHLSGMKGWVKWAARVVLLWRNGLQGHWTNKMEAQSNRIKRQTDSSLMYLFPFFIFYRFCGFYFSLFLSLSPLCLMSRFSHLLRDFIHFFLLLLFAHVTPPCLGKLHALTFGKTQKKGEKSFESKEREHPRIGENKMGGN